VGCGGARWDFSGEFETNNAWHKHGNWLTKHGCFGFDTANTPAENTQPVDHGGVGVSTNTGIRVGAQYAVNFTSHDSACEIFDVDLVDNSHAWGNNFKVIKCSLTPA